MAETNEDPTKCLKEEENKKRKDVKNNEFVQQEVKDKIYVPSDKGKEKKQIEDRQFFQESHVGGKYVERSQPEDDDPEDEVNNDKSVEKNDVGVGESKEDNEKNIELSLKLLCDRIRKTPPKKAWNLHKEQSILAKKVRMDLGKSVFNNEYNERCQQDASVVKRTELLETNKEVCAKSFIERGVCDQIKDKNVIAPNNECKNSVESPKTVSKRFFNTHSSEQSASTEMLPTDYENENKECEENNDCGKTKEEEYKEKDNCDKTEEEECEEKDDCEKNEGEEEDSEDSPSPHRRRGTETETDDTDREDFSTEGLLKELHFLNASCEKPLVKKNATLQIHRTPKKQRKLEFDALSQDSSTFSTPAKTTSKILSMRKRIRSDITSDKTRMSWKAERGVKKVKSCCTSPYKFKESPSKENDSVKQSQMDCRDEESEDGEGSLTIVAHEETSPKKRKRMATPTRSKKKMRGVDAGDVPQEVIELIQSGIDEVLEEKAERTHLTAIHVKNIIKNVMTDDNVLAMVRNTVLGIHDSGMEAPAVYEPTLTRAKTKELMERQAAGVGNGNIWAGLSNSSAGGSTTLNPETHALATTDFPDEDEDEEYTPEADEHLHSDDESLVSAGFSSETGSPSAPCTPSTSHISSPPGSCQSLSTPLSSSLSTPTNRRLMVMKIPEMQRKTVQRMLDFEKVPKREEVVSQRTRSKLPLTETPLECLEMAFKPPDVTNDMYETEVDDDDWKSFLIDFIHPLKSTEAGEDEEADPEYNILEDKEDALDLREEMRGDRAVQISKKEINELMTELLDTLGNNEETEPVRMHLSQHISQKETKKTQFKIPQLCQSSSDKEGCPSSRAIWVEVLTAKFTKSQLEILQCQMAQHVQLLTTSSLLCYGTPLLDCVVDGCIKSLEEMKKSADASDFRNTFFRPFNLEPALETVKNFKKKSSNNLPSDVQLKSYATDVHPLVMETLLESSAFPYPRLLPTRMFQHPNSRGFRKTSFVSSEDMLIAVGLERYLDPKYQSAKCKKGQYSLLLKALALTTENVLVAKTLSQATNRVKNIRCRAKDAPNNPVLQFLETGDMDLPQAEVEPLLPCVPCPVQNFPEGSLANPYQRMVKKRNVAQRHALLAAAQKVALVSENENREAKFRGAGISQKPIQNIVIIQASDSRQIMVPPDAVIPVTSCSCFVDKCIVQQSPAVSLPGKQAVSETIPRSYGCCDQISSSGHVSSPGGNLNTTAPDHTEGSFTVQNNAKGIVSDSADNTLINSLAPSPGSCLLSDNVEMIGEVSEDTTHVILSEDITSNEVGASEIQAPPQRKSLELECKSVSEELKLKRIGNVMDDSARMSSDDDHGDIHNESYCRIRMDVSHSQKTILQDNSDSHAVSENRYLPSMTVESKIIETDDEIKNSNENCGNGTLLDKKLQSVLPVDLIDEKTDIPPKSPEIVHPTSSIPVPYLATSSLSTTPRKSDERDAAPVCLPKSSLCTPVISVQSPDKSFNIPVKAVNEIKQADLSSILEEREIRSTNNSSILKKHLEPSSQCAKVASLLPSDEHRLLESNVPAPSAKVDREKGLDRGKEHQNVDEFRITDNYKTRSPERHYAVVQKTQQLNQDRTPEKLSTQMNAVVQNQVSTQSSSVTLVTSVYQSPIFSSGVGKTDSLNILNITPQKAKTPLRRISPAKGFRSPMKTSPLKQVSPILRKYHKYSPKKRRLVSSSKKLSPILPKISHRSSPGQRRLAPKPSKSSSALEDGIRVRGSNNRRATGSESFFHGTKHAADGDLLQMDDELMETNISASPSRNLSQPAAKVHQSEEDFEEDFLEDEEDEDEEEEEEEDEEEEEEEEDLEAAQQREEHLAALLKASSTITFRRGGGGDGYEKKLNGVGDLGQGERRLTKQQRRLQARITALSSIPDTAAQDKFVAQSYLMRVREALMGKNPAAFKEFLCILTEFTQNPSKSPFELYSQLCEVLKEFPHLTEEFVSFLLPQQAMALGKYAQYCAIHRMKDFLEKLELQYGKQPQIIQKIIRLLQSMQARSDLNIEEIKAAMTPLLKYPHLVECFAQCFPSQPPAPSLQSDFEDISLDHPGTPDSMESLILPDDDINTSPNQCMCPCHASDSSSPTSVTGAHHNPTNTGRTEHCLSCALRFSEGRVYLQCGKTLRPARVTYHAVDLKKEEFDEKSNQVSTVGGNVATECSETSTKGKSVGKGKLSQTKDSNESVSAKTRESVNKMSPSNNANSTTAHVNSSSVLKSRTAVASEEKCVRDDTGSHTEKKDAKGRGDDIALVVEPIFSRNIENTFSKSESHVDGKIPHVKKACLVRGFERTEGTTHVDSTFVKSTSQSKSCSMQNNVNPLKGKTSGFITENSSRSLRNKESPLLPCSPPKEIHNENAVLPSCSKTSSFCNVSTMGELLAQHVSVIDERTNPSASAVIVTDKFELQKEHKATLCHVPLKTPCHQKTTDTVQNSNSKNVSNKTLSVHSAGNIQNSCSLSKSSLSNDTSLRDSKTSSESISFSSSSSNVKSSTDSSISFCPSAVSSFRISSSPSTFSVIETEKAAGGVSQDVESTPLLSSTSKQTVPISGASPTSFKTLTWTKDEDWMILTKVQEKGATDSVFQEIADALPLRDYYEVFDRFNKLVKLIMEDTDIEDSVSVSSEDSTI